MATEYRQRPGGMGDHFDDEDLVMNSAQQRNWRGILIALMVIVAVLAMIVTSVVLLTPPQPDELSDSYSDVNNGDRAGTDYYYNQRANDELWWRRKGMRALRLSDLLSDSANIKLFNGTWISGNEIFYVNGMGDLAVMEVTEDGTIQTTRHLMSKKTLQNLKGPLISFELSPDRNHVLIGHDAKKLFRYSKIAMYTVYTVSTGQITPVTLDDRRIQNGTFSAGLQPHLLHAQWHKISELTEKNVTSMSLIIVYRYDVFYVPWSLMVPTETNTVVIKSNNMTDFRTSNTVGSSPSTTTASLIDDSEKKENVSSSKLSWNPWPHGPVRRITTSGSDTTVSTIGTVSNGVADYLYEMEILKRSPAVWPSSGRYLIYATFDDRQVGEYKYSVYTKERQQREKETKKHNQQQERKRRRRRRRIRRNTKPNAGGMKYEDETSEYYLYPEIRTIRYPKANSQNPVVTLSVIVNLDRLGNPQVQPKIRTLTPPPIFQYTDDYYFTAVQWVNDGGVSGVGGSHKADDNKSGASAAEVCVVWLNRAQNTSVTTLCKSPMWMCQVTQVINAAGTGRGSGNGVGQGDTITSDRPRRRYRRNGNGSQKSPPETVYRINRPNNNESTSYPEDRHRRGQHQHQSHGGKRQRYGHHSRRRRAGNVQDGDDEGTKQWYGGWVDATVGGAGGGVPSTGTGNGWDNGDGDNFAGDDGYAGVSGVGDAATSAGYTAATLVRRGWETGDKELTPRAPVFATDGQGYVSVAPVRDDSDERDGDNRDGDGRVRLRRPSAKSAHFKGRWPSPSSVPSVGKYFAQVVSVNITKKMLAPLTFGELENEEDNNKENADTKSWTVVRILAWNHRTDMIYFLAVPSGRGAPHHRHLYAVKFTSASTANVDAGNRATGHHQQNEPVHRRERNWPRCLSCEVESSGETHHRERREFGGKQNRMDEARDDRLRQQQREQHLKEQEKNNEEQAAANAEEAGRRQQQNRQQQQQDMLNRGKIRHCTYYDAQFSRDGSHYALVCLGPSVPYVTLHKIVLDDEDNDDVDSIKVASEVEDLLPKTQKWLKDPSCSYQFVALIENNTRLQDKYTNRVLLPGTRTFQLRLSGGRKLSTSGGLHFNDPLAAAEYYGNGGDKRLHFSARKPLDFDPLTVAQVRLYLPLGVYDPEADPRPEFMLNHVESSDRTTSKDDSTISATTTGTSGHSPSTTPSSRRRRRRRSSSSNDGNMNNRDKLKRQQRLHKQQRHRRFNKLYPILVVVNSDPGSQAITDRFTDRLGYTTGLLCSGSLGRTPSNIRIGNVAGARYGSYERDRRRQRGHRDRRSTETRYYSSEHSDDYDNDFYNYDQGNDGDKNNNEYVVAVIDPGRGTWARGYESLLALNYGEGIKRFGDYNGEDYDRLGGSLGTSDLRDQLEAIQYLLSSATNTGENFKDNGQGYYSEDRPKGGRGSRDRSRWFSSSSQSNRRYYSDDDDFYDENEEYIDNNDKSYNEDYYYYYYNNDEDNNYYGDSHRGDEFYKDRDGKINHKERRSTGDTKANSEALRLPYVDGTRVALLGGGPTSPSTPSSIYGGYASARMAIWQSIYGGAPIERKNTELNDNGNRKEPVTIRSSFKCAITMAPVSSWRMYASAFSERYYGYYSGNGEETSSYDRSNLIPFTKPLNKSSFSPSSYGKGINLLVIHGTADTTVHPQHSMMLVREVMQHQQQQHISIGPSNNLGRRNKNVTTGGRVINGFSTKVGAIRISQLVIPDADLSNSRVNTNIENGSPIDNQHQLLYSIYNHITHYLSTECFTDVGDGNKVQGGKVRGQQLRMRRRKWRTGNRDQEKPREEEYQQHKQNQRIVDNNDENYSSSGIDGSNGGDHNTRGRYRRNYIDISQHNIFDNEVNKSISINWVNSYKGGRNNTKISYTYENKVRKKNKISNDEINDNDENDDETEDDENEDAYYDEDE